MDVPEFLDRLRAIEAQWEIVDGADIRCARGDCPLTAVARTVKHESFTPAQWEDAAAVLDMDYEDAQAIVDAADLNSDYDEDLRADLRAATTGRR